MSSKSNLKKKLKKNLFFTLLINYKRIIFERISLLLYDDYSFVKKEYHKRLKREIDLKNPKRFMEKLQWVKLFYRNPLMPVCADKARIRDFLHLRGYGEYGIPVFKVYKSVNDIDFDSIPEKCIMKASHGSSMHLVINKSEFKNKFLAKLVMKSWLKMNIYAEGREWPYKEVKPAIVCEYFIEPKTENKLRDYKLFCFNGLVRFIQVDIDLLSDNHNVNFYDADWNLLTLKGQYPNFSQTIERPENFDDMKKIAEDLSSEFPHVRVDFYGYDDQLKIGELTFFDGSGFYQMSPDKYDFEFGEKFILPEPNYNLELYERIMKGQSK